MGLIVEDEDIKFNFDVYGYKWGNNIVDIDDSLTNISDFLGDLQFKMNNVMYFFSKNKLMKEAQLFLENYFSLHDIMFLNEQIVSNIKLCSFLEVSNINDIIRVAKDKIILMKPYNIPIKYNSDSMVKSVLVDDSLCFYGIDLENKYSKNIIPEYVHELVHTQLMSCRGIIANYHNREVLSIFLEKLSALMLDSSGRLIHNISIGRYFDLFKCIKYLENEENIKIKLEASIYIVSTLKANKLFDMFVNGNNNIKKEIISGIQNVFDGSVSLEEFLEKFDISFDNSKDINILKRQLKICKKRRL